MNVMFCINASNISSSLCHMMPFDVLGGKKNCLRSTLLAIVAMMLNLDFKKTTYQSWEGSPLVRLVLSHRFGKAGI